MGTRAASIFCRTTLNYAPATSDVIIRNGREAGLPGWEECGFELQEHASAVSDWDDDAEIARVHHPEIEGLATALTGCDFALVSSHIKRGPEAAARHHDLAPISFVHSDFADSYGDKIRARYLRPDAETDEAMHRSGATPDDVAGARRLLILQFWRNLGPAKMDLPLAFCDARTVPRDDTRAFPVTNYAGGGFDFEALAIAAPADPTAHDWYVFPELAQNEVVTFRTYDTDRIAAGEPYWTPHSAFRDPEVALGQPARTSIELRATCLFA